MGKTYNLTTIQEVLEMSTDEMIPACTDFLLDYFEAAEKSDPKVYILDDDFVYAIGESPITIVAHVDTVRDRYVHKVPTKNTANIVLASSKKDDSMVLCQNRNVLTNLNGVLGADDRAGVFGCLEIVRRCSEAGLPLPSVILTNGEESGGIGVGAFCRSKIFEKHDQGRTKLFVEMDRCNATEWVTYGAKLPSEVVDYVESFGFHKGHGSYSDIADLQEEYLIPAVNVSIGYYSQHSASEKLHVDEMYLTIDRVFQMVKDPIDKLYKVDPDVKGYGWDEDWYNHYNPKNYGNNNHNKPKTETPKTNVNKTTKGVTSFPQGKPGKTSVDNALDAITRGGFCISCGHIWSDCECGEMLKDIAAYMYKEEIEFLLENYLFPEDSMHVLLTAFLEMENEKIDAVDVDVVADEGTKLLIQNNAVEEFAKESENNMEVGNA
jgi:hypothetical protein